MGENREFMLAIALSIAVLIGWQFFVGIPRLEQQKARQAEQQAQQQSQQQAAQTSPQAGSGTAVPSTVPTPGAPGAQPLPPGAIPGTATTRGAATFGKPADCD